MGAGCAVAITFDEIPYPQKMRIMNGRSRRCSGSLRGWLLTTLGGCNVAYAGKGKDAQPFAAIVIKGTSHCGAACTLGGIVVERSAFAFRALPAMFGWHTVFNQKTFAVWIPDFVVAFLLGIVFRYFTIKPMRGLSVRAGVLAGVKADVASITAWHAGMYGLVAIIQFLWFKPVYGGLAEVASPEFWFAM